MLCFIHTVAVTALAFLASSSVASLVGETTLSFRQVGQALNGDTDSNGTITALKDIGFGATIALSSNDGTRLLVGAHNFTATDGTGTLVEEGGAVFLYDYDGATGTWEYTTHWTGEPNEELGRWPISISADGGLVAIRRGLPGRPAEVYSVDEFGVKTKMGGDIICDDAGNMVSLTETPDGTKRLAAACEFDGAEESGNVNVFDWNGTEWEPLASLSVDSSGTTSGLFGFDMSFANQGSRLALSAPNFNASSGEEGLVAVFDYDGAAWIQLGGNLTGTQQNQKFGFTMALSEDGTTLVVGSPNKDGDGLLDSGSVQVYTLNVSNNIWDLQQEIAGDAAGDVFGRGVAVNSEGTRFSASSYKHDGDRGQVKVFGLDGGAFSQKAVFVGSESGDWLGYNTMGVAMTREGSRIAMASSHSETNGKVQVFEEEPIVISDDYENQITKFDWDIEFLLPQTEFTFSEKADTSEVKLFYNVSLRETIITAYEIDCSTPIPTNVTELSSTLTATSTMYADLEVFVDIKQDTVTESTIWEDKGTGKGQIAMCIRLDLVLPSTTLSVNYHEMKFFINVETTQGFNVTDISLDRTAATNETGTGAFDYQVSACHCDPSSFDCYAINDPNSVLTQGSDITLCVETAAPNVRIADIRSLTMTQGEGDDAVVTNPIENGAEDPLTQTTINGKNARVQYQVISDFFKNEDPADIIATGTVLLEFYSEEGSRMLRSVSIRDLTEESNEGFEVPPIPVKSAAAEQTSSANLIGSFTGIVSGIAGLLISFN
jgi:hypothetical protein